jgi:predicted TIM-barrel fold metal-dependent hydrolase
LQSRATAPVAPELLDCDLVLGRDVPTDRWATLEDVRRTTRTEGISGGVVSSLRAVHFDVSSGNDEVAMAAAEGPWLFCPVLDLRDPLGAERELERWADRRPHPVRLAPTAQGADPLFPAFEHVARLIAQLGLVALVEGDVRTVSRPFRGLDANVVFLDTHFYHLGDFVVLARGEPGFATSTRLLNGPDSLELVAGEVGAHRLVLGTRTPFHETRSAVRRLLSSRLTPAEVALAGSGNLRRLLELP